MKNEYTSCDQFLSQYIGEWSPSEGHWLGLDFCWKGQAYRFQTDSMYNAENTILSDGREARFGVYKKIGNMYELIGEYATPREALEQCRIGDALLGDIIIDESTELLGQD